MLEIFSLHPGASSPSWWPFPRQRSHGTKSRDGPPILWVVLATTKNSRRTSSRCSLDLFLIAQIDGGSGIDARGLVKAVDGECALVGVYGRSRTVGERGDAELIEHVEVSPHARGLHEWLRWFGSEIC